MENKIELNIERSSDNYFFGRVKYDGNLIVDSAKKIEALKKRMKKHLEDFHQLNPATISFKIVQ